MSQRLAVVGFLVALVIAIFAFVQQQQAVDEARAAQKARVDAQAGQGTAVAQAQDAANQQQQAESGAATLMVNAQKAATGQAEAISAQSTAVSGMNAASTANAKLDATGTAQRDAMQATGQAGADMISTVQAETTAELSTAQAQIDAQATTQTSFDSALGTATAQVDLAEFARQSAEDDRMNALAQAWAAATALADREEQLATAQAIINSVTATPTAQPAPETPVPTTAAGAQATTASPEGTPTLDLTETFTSKNGTISFRYPGGWVAAELDSGLILIGSSNAVLQRSAQAIPTGELEVQMLVIPIVGFRGLKTGAVPGEVIKVFSDILTQQGGTASTADIQEGTIGSYRAAQMPASDGTNDVLITTADLGSDVYVVTFSSTAKGEQSSFIEIMDKIIASITYKP